MDFSKHIGKTVKTIQGGEVKLVAHVPEAWPSQEIVGFHSKFGINTYSRCGQRYSNRTSSHDLMPPTTTVRMRAYRHPNGTVQGVVVDQWPDFQLWVDTGKAAWVSEPFDVEIEA